MVMVTILDYFGGFVMVWMTIYMVFVLPTEGSGFPSNPGSPTARKGIEGLYAGGDFFPYQFADDFSC